MGKFIVVPQRLNALKTPEWNTQKILLTLKHGNIREKKNLVLHLDYKNLDISELTQMTFAQTTTNDLKWHFPVFLLMAIL